MAGLLLMGLLQMGTACRAQTHSRSCHVFQRQNEKTREPEGPAPPSARNLTSSSLGLTQKPQLFVQGRTEILQQKQQGTFGFTKSGGRKSPDILPLEGASDPLLGTLPKAGGGLTPNPVSRQSPRPEG